MKIEQIQLDKLIPYARNARINDATVSGVAASIKEFGFQNPIIIDKENVIIAGHTRLKAAQQLGLDKAPCLRAEGLTDEQVKAYRLLDNKLQEKSEWDLELLNLELEELDFDFAPFDVEFPSLQPEQPEVVDDEYKVPDEIETFIKLGDIIEIGRHRFMCGDSTDGDQVAVLMDGEKADMAHNDPPYGMKKEKEGVLNDNLNFDDLLQFNHDWISLQFTHLKENGSFYCWGTDEPLMDIYSNILKPYIKTQKATFRNLITWDKGHGQGQNAEEYRMYPIADEKCLFVMCGVQDFKFERNESKYNIVFESIRVYFEKEKEKSKLKVDELSKIDSTRCSHYWAKSQWEFPTKESYKIIQSYCEQNNIDAFQKEYDELKKEYDELKKEYDELKKEYYSTRAYFNNIHDNQNNVWHFDRTSNKERETTGGHATPKPVALCERVIKSSCPDNGLVLDSFLGSGSTMVAAHQLNRICYGMELEPKYCQVVIDRMKKLDESIEIKINGEPFING